MAICQVVSPHCIMCKLPTTGEFQDELGRGTDAKLHPVDPLSLIERFIIAELVTRIVPPANHDLDRTIVVSTAPSTAIVHHNHLFV